MNRTITTQQLASATDFSLRYVQKTAKDLGIKKTKGSYIFTKEEAERIKKHMAHDVESVETITQEYTQKEYERLEAILKDNTANKIEKEYLKEQIKYLENQLEYLRKSLDHKNLETEKILSTFEALIRTNSERNTLDFIDKTGENPIK